MNAEQIVSIHQKSIALNDGYGGIVREQTDIGEIEASTVTVHTGGYNGHSFRTTWMLNKKRIAYAKLMEAVRAA